MNSYKKTVLLFIILLASVFSVSARQNEKEIQRDTAVPAHCGDIIQGEFSANYQETTYTIKLKAGDSLDVSLTPLGTYLKTAILLTGPTKIGIGISNGRLNLTDGNFQGVVLEEQPKLTTDVLPASGNYTIRMINFPFYLYKYAEDYYHGYFGELGQSGGIGNYTLYIHCTLADGGTSIPAPTSTTPFTGSGFPGLAPVDFSSAFKVSLNLTELNEGEIPTTGNNVLGFKFKANANDKMNLSFTRVSGNLNLGLVVLSSTNQVIYMSALVNTETMSAQFPLPNADEYTIGVFRLELLPPSTPVNTAFQIQASLNS